jgi:hypothetical protein
MKPETTTTTEGDVEVRTTTWPDGTVVTSTAFLRPIAREDIEAYWKEFFGKAFIKD